jgi:Holliday junction resolvase RusA-like endonuclease
VASILDMLQPDEIFIPGNVASGKNSKRIVSRGNRIALIKSKASMKYLDESLSYWKKNTDKFLQLIKDKPLPLRVEFTLIRKDKRMFDYINLLQLPQDIMQSCGWIPDDNADNLIPIVKPYLRSKTNPGIIIKVL